MRERSEPRHVAASKMRFPGFAACLKRMRSHDAETQEEGFGWLARQAADHLPELIAEFEQEQARGGPLRGWLLELIGEARSFDAFDLLARCLNAPETADIRHWAVWGLKELDTREARRALWEAGVE